MGGTRTRSSLARPGLRRGFAAIAVVALLAVPVVLAVPAQAQLPEPDFTFTGSDFFLPRDADQTDQEGVERFVASFDLVANGLEDLVGQTCAIIVLAGNGDSVHLNNFGLIVTGGSETNVLETESEPNVLRTVLDDPTLVLGETMELYNIMVPDPENIVATSVEYFVSVFCAEQTTTTPPETTTTPPETTTTPPETTTTPPETTTTPPETTTTPPETTTTPPETTTTTIPITTTSISATTVQTLPFTGPGAGGGWLSLGAALLVAGAVALGAARRRSEDTAPDKPFSSG